MRSSRPSSTAQGTLSTFVLRSDTDIIPEKHRLPETLPEHSLKIPPAPPTGRWVLWVMLAFSISLVTGVVLLSNDMRHLKTIALKFGYRIAEPGPPMIQPVPGPAKPPRIFISPPLIEPVISPMSGVFLPRSSLSGRDLCVSLKKSGLNVSDWEQAAFGGSTYECSYETDKGDGSSERTLFLLVRGGQSGNVSNVRIKLVNPELDGNHQLSAANSAIVETVLTQAGFSNAATLLARVRTLMPFRQEEGGLSLSLSKEMTERPSYNLIIARDNRQRGPQSRSFGYFTPQAWFPVPDDAGVYPLP